MSKSKSRSRSMSEGELPVRHAELMSTKKKIAILNGLLDESKSITNRSSSDPTFKVWKNNVERALIRMFGSPSTEMEHFSKLAFHFNPGVWFSGVDYSQDHRQAFERDMQIMLSAIKAYVAEFESSEESDAELQIDDPIEQVLTLLRRFAQVARQLRHRRQSRSTLEISDEYDVQDLLHALLLTCVDDVRAEEWIPSYAGGASRMDFLLKRERVVVEAKMTRSKLGDKEIGEQLLIDIAKYEAHPDCRTLVCFVYDPDHHIRNAAGLTADLEAQSRGTLRVRTLIVS